jgi:hypothetical protein
VTEQGTATTTPLEAVRRPHSARSQTRWLVHLGLIATFVGTLAALVGTTGTTLHIVIGLAFFALVVVHVGQRRRTAQSLLAGLAHVRVWLRPRGRLAVSDLVLAGLTLNVLASGLVDWLEGYKVELPLTALGLPENLMSWHALSALALTAYLAFHVVRRRNRLRSSSIR